MIGENNGGFFRFCNFNHMADFPDYSYQTSHFQFRRPIFGFRFIEHAVEKKIGFDI